jgi:hypothetical protein
MSKKDRELQQQSATARSDSDRQKQQRPDAGSGKMKSPQSGLQQQGSNQSQGGFANWEHKHHLDE